MSNLSHGGVWCLLVCLHLVACMPKKDELMFESGDDTALVESTVRMARAAPKHIDDLLKPGVKDAYLHVYGDKAHDDGDVHGYLKKMNDKGADGYKHFDTFHKKDGDKYGYESHSEYGQGNKAEYDSGNKKKGSKKGNDGEETQNSYKVLEEESDDGKGKQAVESEASYYGEDGDSGFYPQGDGESSYEEGGSETTSYSSKKKTGDGDGEGKTYHDADEGSYESSFESDAAEDGEEEGESEGDGY